jgi:hypothetical protein
VASLTSPPASLRGATRPRVEVAPPYAYSLGQEAIELAARAGLHLDFWQQQALVLMLAVRDDGKWACFEYGEIVARQNGKGGILEARALAGLFLLGEQLIMWSAHEYKTAMEAFRRVLALVRALGEVVSDNLIDLGGVLVKVVNTNGEESLERLDTGQRLKFIARSKGSGRGFSGDVNIIDETLAYTQMMHAALMPTMNARPNPQIVYTSSPPLTGDTGEVLYQLRERAEAGGDDSLGWRDWGLSGDLDHLDEIDLDEVEVWAATNPALGIRITLETLRRLRRSMGRLEFAREILGVWPRPFSAGGGPIDLDLWASLADAGSQIDSPVVFAIDATPDHSQAAIAVGGRRADGLEHVEVIDDRAGLGWVVDRAVELRDRWKPLAFLLDPSGPAGSLLPDLHEAGIEPELVTGREMAQACGAFFDAVADQRFRHLDQEELNAALRGARTRPLGDAWAWHRKDSTVNIAPLVTATLARHGFAVHGARDLDVAASVW